MINKILDSASNYTRNPLGIVGLFMCLMYGVMAILLSTMDNFTIGQQWAFVILMCLFPFISLGSIMWLVAFHSNKLYSPSDFKEDNSYLKMIGINEQIKKIDEDIDIENKYKTDTESIEINTNARESRWRYSLLLEELLLRKLEKENNIYIKRNVKIESFFNELPVGTSDEEWRSVNSKRISVIIDGVFSNENETVILEIKYWKGSISNIRKYIETTLPSLVEYITKLIDEITREFGKKKCILQYNIILDQKVDTNTIAYKEIIKYSQKFTLPVEIQFYTPEDLKLSN